MPYNEKLADRVRELMAPLTKNIEEKVLFGGLCFMVNDKMCVGVKLERMLVRVDPAINDEVLEMEGCIPMLHGGKAIKGFVFVDIKAVSTKKKLEYWVKLSLAFNKFASASKKKKTKK